jgi:ATP-binding cassette subfamily B protein
MSKIPFLSKLKSLKPLWDALSPRRRSQLLALQLLSIAAAIGEVANLGALLPFLKLLANPQEGLKAIGPIGVALIKSFPTPNLLLGLGIGFIMVATISALLRVITIRFQLRLAALISSDFGEKIFRSVLGKTYSWHLNHNSSTTMGYLTKDVDQVSSSVQGLLLVVVNLAIVILLGASLISLSPGIMITLSIILAGFYITVFQNTRGKLREDGVQLTENYQGSIQIAQEALGGIRDVILDATQNFFIDSYRRRNLQFRLAGASINIKAQIPRYLIEGFSVVLIVGLSLNLTLTGQGVEKQLPLLGTLALGAYRLLQPLQQCFNGLSGLQANQASLKRIEPFLQSNQTLENFSSSNELRFLEKHKSRPLIRLEKICFRYSPKGPDVLNNLDLSIKCGERIAFVGSTGSGKSTCSDLILGLLKPTQGQVLVHDKDLNVDASCVTHWQRRVAHVPQQIYLSDASYASNIAFGVPENQIDHQRVRICAKQARIDDVIETSLNGYFTVVGERGVRLSGGQRQRIGIARALYKQAEMLILDEATSALDNRTEAEVMEAIENLDRDLTILIIAHRLSTVRNCDRIVVLEKGQISAIGTYQALESSHTGFQRLAAQERNQINS